MIHRYQHHLHHLHSCLYDHSIPLSLQLSQSHKLLPLQILPLSVHYLLTELFVNDIYISPSALLSFLTVSALVSVPLLFQPQKSLLRLVLAVKFLAFLQQQPVKINIVVSK